MRRLNEIPIRLEAPAARTGGLGGGVAAVLSELAGLLRAVAGGGAPAVIDLRSLPMSPGDRQELQAVLGEGEVRATVDADGESSIRETGISGLWWVEHRNRDGQVIAESIEIARVPPFIESTFDDMSRGAQALEERLGSAGDWATEKSGHATRQ